MNCKICGKSCKKIEIINGMCSECMQGASYKLWDVASMVEELVEQELTKDIPRQEPIDPDKLFDYVGKQEPAMTMEQFKQAKITRQLFILVLLKNASIQVDPERYMESQIIDDMEHIIDHQLEKIWAKPLKVIVTDDKEYCERKGYNVYARELYTYIVELTKENAYD